MIVKDLQRALKDIQSLLDASGSKKPAGEISNVIELLDGKTNQDLDHVLGQIKAEISPIEKSVRELKTAGTDEVAFQAAFQQLKASRLAKNDLAIVAREYTGRALASDSREKLLKSISTHFYVLAYERDSRAMAKAATPW